MKKELSRNATLDALRGIAAIIVVLLHVNQRLGVTGLTPYGFFSVDLFFMISGFVIGQTYEARLNDGLSTRKFMVIRALRLVPCLLLGTIAGAVAQLANHAKAGDVLITAMLALFLVPSIWGAVLFASNNVFWSLFFEIYINIFHATFLKLLLAKHLAILVAVAGLLFITSAILLHSINLGSETSTIWAGIFRVGWGYGIGLLIYRLHYSGKLAIPKVYFCVPVLLAAAALAAPRVLPSVIHSGLILFVLLPLVVALSPNSYNPRWGKSVWTFLGSISFPLYAIHYPLITLVHTIIGAQSAYFWPLLVMAVIAVASLVEIYFDKPLRSLFRNMV